MLLLHPQEAYKFCQLKLWITEIIRYFITSADKICKLPEDCVITPKHVIVMLILILYYFYVHLLVY
jgi:hypothetical protein